MYFDVCTSKSCFGYFERVVLAYSHAIAANGTLSDSRLCNVMVKCCLMEIYGVCVLICDLMLGMVVSCCFNIAMWMS